MLLIYLPLPNRIPTSNHLFGRNTKMARSFLIYWQEESCQRLQNYAHTRKNRDATSKIEAKSKIRVYYITSIHTKSVCCYGLPLQKDQRSGHTHRGKRGSTGNATYKIHLNSAHVAPNRHLSLRNTEKRTRPFLWCIAGKCLVNNMSRGTLDEVMQTWGFSTRLLSVELPWVSFCEETNGSVRKHYASKTEKQHTKFTSNQHALLQQDVWGYAQLKREPDLSGSNTQ